VPAAPPSVTDFGALLRVLSDAGVEFIVIGGVAGVAHGSARLTRDLDVVYARSPENLERLTRALQPLEPYLRGAPAGLPFRFDPDTVRRGLNFTLRTTLGELDLLGEVTGGGAYPALLAHSRELDMFGVRCRCLDLDKLIEVKRAAGRPKDLEAIAELEVIRDERRERGI
jgi:predicted nucleotidyltransferase